MATPAPAASAAPALDVTLEEVHGPAGRDAFVRFQLEHYRGDPLFVPPVVAERKDFLDPRVNPFFKQGRAALFLARRRGRVVGRVAAIVDTRYNRYHDLSDGFFGLFESQNDAGLAAALLDAAGRWVRQQGMNRLVGPVNLAFHYDGGLLVEGFDRPPSMMMPYNHAYYPRLVEASGFAPLKDLWSYELDGSGGLPEKIDRLAERVRRGGLITVRQVNTRAPEEDIRRLQGIFDSMLSQGFGFAPISQAEFDEVVERMRPLVMLRPELCLLAERQGEAVAFSVTLPEINIALKAAGGYLFPFGMARLLWATRNIDRLRVLLFGIKDGYRRRGIDALLSQETFRRAAALGYHRAELGWVREDDRMMNRTIQATGARRIKTFRVYQRPL